MKVVKHNILTKEVKLRPADFIRKIRKGIHGRVNAFDFAFNPISAKIQCRKRLSCKKSDIHIEEIWCKRKKAKKSYFNLSKLSKTVLSEPSKSKKSSIIKDKSTHPRNVFRLLPNNDVTVSSEEKSPPVKEEDGIIFYPQGEFIPVDSKWQKDKFKMFKLTFIIGIITEDQSTEKTLDIRRLAPSKEKRILSDRNRLFSSLNYVITGTD